MLNYTKTPQMQTKTRYWPLASSWTEIKDWRHPVVVRGGKEALSSKLRGPKNGCTLSEGQFLLLTILKKQTSDKPIVKIILTRKIQMQWSLWCETPATLSKRMHNHVSCRESLQNFLRRSSAWVHLMFTECSLPDRHCAGCWAYGGF